MPSVRITISIRIVGEMERCKYHVTGHSDEISKYFPFSSNNDSNLKVDMAGSLLYQNNLGATNSAEWHTQPRLTTSPRVVPYT